MTKTKAKTIYYLLGIVLTSIVALINASQQNSTCIKYVFLAYGIYAAVGFGLNIAEQRAVR